MSTGRAQGWSFSAPLWRWREGSWHFVTVPQAVSDEVDEAVGDATGGFGSVRVEVTVGATVWRTSLFPSTEEAAYVLPVKKAVRTAEGLLEGEPAQVTVRLVTG
ncbi:DUF1905 domain-containing protein [Phycicoccus sonneratiae]|uniref:DUF1905 domain-containing protein n=1 Tax=Phycicoccus sonneratiae TaxID=2807628 RepID=A0ABS2CQ23_9MICO|nr:DUF1905 domain-containing protein [Phycicoccus sonneraticus]MBM6401987.1 DUF1905 domain-containing protein [Phycicoccus sonneraticus]